jgi:hypothetical protein
MLANELKLNSILVHSFFFDLSFAKIERSNESLKKEKNGRKKNKGNMAEWLKALAC